MALQPGPSVAIVQPGLGPSVAIVWLRRDLRVEDNPALVAALHAAHLVVPVFIWAPKEEGQFQPGRCLRWWLHHSLLRFQAQLAALGSRLIIRRSDDSAAALEELIAETGAQSVFFNHLYDAISLVRDHEVKQKLGEQGVCVRSFNADLLYEPWEVVDANERPFTSFRTFWDRVLTMPYPPALPLPSPNALPAVPSCLPGLSVDEVGLFLSAEDSTASEALGFQWQPGMEGAVQRLNAFLESRLKGYAANRAKVDRGSSSELSPWIHSGTISVRHMYYRVRQKQQEWLLSGEDCTESCLDFLQQMGYREYGRYLSFHFPFITERALLAHLRAVPWRIDQRSFKAWKMGMTGYSLIDAGMKQLWSTGWIHNRLRVVCGTFLVKNLLLPWQWGLKHFWDAFLDADLENDALGWQYVAGCMADAHPFSDMLDIDKEALQFDPDGEYVRRWLPVLARLPTQYIHAPFRAPLEVLEAADVELGFNYPKPIISIQESEEHMAAAVLAIRMCAAAEAGDTQQPFRPATEPSREVMEAVQRLRESQTANGRVPPMPQGTVNGLARMPAEQQRRKEQQERYHRQQQRKQQQERRAEEAAADTYPDGHSSASEGHQDEEEGEGGKERLRTAHRHKRRIVEEQQSQPEDGDAGHAAEPSEGAEQQEQHDWRQRRRERSRAAERARHDGGDGVGIETEEVASNAPPAAAAAASLSQAANASEANDLKHAHRLLMQAHRRRNCEEGVQQVPSISDAVALTEMPQQPKQCTASATQPHPAEQGVQGGGHTGSTLLDAGPSHVPEEPNAGIWTRTAAGREVVGAEEGAASGDCGSVGERTASQEVTCQPVRGRRAVCAAAGATAGPARGCPGGSPAASVGEVAAPADTSALNGQGAATHTGTDAGDAAGAPAAADGTDAPVAATANGVQQISGSLLPGHEWEVSQEQAAKVLEQSAAGPTDTIPAPAAATMA